jgi:hypothetical protein
LRLWFEGSDMTVLSPGTLLQSVYLQERLVRISPGRFIEIGPGSGEIAQLLPDLGWTGKSFDLDSAAIERLQIRFADEIGAGRYLPITADYLMAPTLRRRPIW